MDINETKFHLVLNRREWGIDEPSSPESDIIYNTGRHAVTLRPELFRFPTVTGSVVLTSERRRGAVMDQYGNWYWISQDGLEIRTSSPAIAAGESQLFWGTGNRDRGCSLSREPGAFVSLEPETEPEAKPMTGLAVTAHHYLVAGLQGGLLVFDLHAGGSPMQLFLPSKVAFAPFDMAPVLDGSVWVLDSQNRRVWKLDRNFQVVPIVRQPEENGSPPREPYASIYAEHAVAIEDVGDGSVLILDTVPGNNYSTIYRCFLADNESQHSIVHIHGHDLAYLPEEGTVYIADSAGNQSFAYGLGAGAQLALQGLYLPMRLYSGKALVAVRGKVYYDMKNRWLPLTPMPRPRYRQSGTLEVGGSAAAFDGKEPGCVWHRIFLDACIPQGTAVTVESFAADSKTELPGDVDWNVEPNLYRRADGAELAYYDPFGGERSESTGTWELLFQEAKGRYLYLRLILTGTGSATPVIYALRAYYPRFSYLKNYLPAVYRRDETSASFMDRFLANMEGFYTVLEDRIAQAQTLFDVDTTAQEYLDWLAGWFGVVLEPEWEESRRRLFLRHAIELFNQRGTPAGLVRAIRLAIDPCPDDSLFEDEETGCCAQSGGTGGFTVRIVESFLETTPKAHHFTLLVPIAPGTDSFNQRRKLDLVRRIVEMEKPTHTFCHVKPFWAAFRVGSARLGLDTIPGEGSRFTSMMLGYNALGEHVLASNHPWNVEGRRVVGRDQLE